MTKYRLKSKLYGEFDKPAEKKGGLTFKGALGLAATGALAVKGYKMAGAGKFGVGAQNAVNSFRMNTSKIGSQRYNDARNVLSTNRLNEMTRFNEYSKATGMSAADISTGRQAVNNKYANLMFGRGTGQSAVQASQAAAAATAAQNSTATP